MMQQVRRQLDRVHLEVIGTTLSDVRSAEAAGADRIELITAIQEGGLTPSLALVEQAVETASIPVRVMVRPHARSFVYDQDDMKTIVRDVELIASVGAEAIVFGALTEDGKVDERALEQVFKAARSMKMTFHRAIDESRNLLEAFKTVQQYEGITDILTSGGADRAPEAVEQFKALLQESGPQGIHIMAGAGLNLQNITDFVRESGVSYVHFGSGVRRSGDAMQPIDAARVQELRQLLDQAVLV